MADSDPDEFFDCANANNLQDEKNLKQLSEWGGRMYLPAKMLSRSDFSIWDVLKQCIGKELSKITMPLVFNEPISFLQRLVEHMEYVHLLHEASVCNDDVRRFELVTAFAVSALASTRKRVGKPFNPLLHETYEYLQCPLKEGGGGFQVVCEQVSHHPPVSAFHAISDAFVFHGHLQPELKFWGRSVDVTPGGLLTLHLKNYKEAYTWQSVNCCVHNVVVGKLWIEQHGSMEITNHRTSWKSALTFHQVGWFGKNLHRVDGHLLDEKSRKVRAFGGRWPEALFSFPVAQWTAYAGLKDASLDDDDDEKNVIIMSQSDNHETNVKFMEEAHNSDVNLNSNKSCNDDNNKSCNTNNNRKSCNDNNNNNNDSKNNNEKSDTKTTTSTTPPKTRAFRLSSYSTSFLACVNDSVLLWHVSPRPPLSQQYYSFTSFAMHLNDLQGIKRHNLPPTDSRLRPDLRLMEDGRIDEASSEKNRLEEKQRAARKGMKKNEQPKPRWFKQAVDAATGKEIWQFNGQYFKRQWSQCADIF